MSTPPPTQVSPPSGGLARGTLVPCATAFIASACVMIMELLAFRLVTRYLGNSNYTTTAIIGVVLGGLALGNYIGGAIADRYRSISALATLFVLASAGCFAVPMLNALVGEWSVLWFLSWPMRIAIHVFLSFFIPCTLLGTIGPVVAKMALDRGRSVGRTVGGVYAWGVLGSLMGTFASGFVLIPRYGLFTINHVVAAILAIMAILFAGRRLLPYGWGAATCVLLMLIFGLPWGPQTAWGKTRAWAANWGLRDDEGPDVLFDRASEYSQVRVENVPRSDGRRVMLLDKLAHSFYNPERPNELQYGYEQIFGGITDQYTRSTDAFRALVLGGGGFTHPRMLLRERPNCHVDVVEIDPVVTEAALATFGLSLDERMSIFHLDARQHVIALNRAMDGDEAPPPYKFVFLDAINDFIVPPHLTTQEFQKSVKRILAPDGVFLMNLVEILDEGRFLASVLTTLRTSFAHVDCYFATDGDANADLDVSERYTFVVVATDAPPPDIEVSNDLVRYMTSHRMPDDALAKLLAKPGIQLLTDDSAPVEAMLANLPIRSSAHDATRRFYNRGNRAADEAARRGAALEFAAATDHFRDAVREYQRALELDERRPAGSPAFHLVRLNLGMAQVEEAGRLGNRTRRLIASQKGSAAEIDSMRAAVSRHYDEAAASFEDVIKSAPNFIAGYYNLAQIRLLQQRFDEAIPVYRRCLELSPEHVPAQYGLGLALANTGQLAEASAALEAVLQRQPNHPTAREHLNRIQAAMAGSQPASTAP